MFILFEILLRFLDLIFDLARLAYRSPSQRETDSRREADRCA